MEQIRVGIIGTGGFAAKRAKCVLALDNAELAWVCSRKIEKAEEFIESLDTDNKSIMPKSNWASALEDQDADAVIIATPNYLHFDQGTLAMNNKLNVLLEFPHATSTDEGNKLLELSSKNNLILHVGLTHRLNARHRVFKPACARDSVKPLSYSISGTEACGKWYDSIPLTGGKFMGGMLPYLVDSVRDCMGPVVSISGTYSTKTKDGVEKGDVRGITMQFESGSVAQIVNVRNVSKPAHVFRHTILFDDNTIIEERKGKLQYTTPGMDDREEDLSNGAHSEIDTVMEDTACFIDAIRFPEHEDSTAVDAQETLRLVELAKNSIRESGAF